MSPGHESLPSRDKIEKVEDLEGVKIRMPSGIPAEIFSQIGASPVSLPLSEAFSALEKGIVDAADAGTIYYNERIGIYDHAKFTTVPGFHSTPIVDFSVNSSKWEALPADLQRIIEIAMRNMAEDYVAKRIVDDQAALERAVGAGVTPVAWSEEERSKFREIARDVWTAWGERGDFAARAIDSQVEYLKTIGLLE